VEKISLGKAHGVPSWLKEGYTSLVADLRNTSLPDISALGWETAFRIVWAHIQATDKHLGLDPNSIFCGYCRMINRTSQKIASFTSECPRCGHKPNAWSRDNPCVANISIPFSTPFPTELSTQVATQKVLEVFEDELKDAELRSA
jgi:hypothetical protein